MASRNPKCERCDGTFWVCDDDQPWDGMSPRAGWADSEEAFKVAARTQISPEAMTVKQGRAALVSVAPSDAGEVTGSHQTDQK